MLRRLLRVAFVGPEAGQMRRFFVVGAGAAVVQTGLLAGLVEWGEIGYLVAAAVSIEATIILQYGVNNRWTFRRVTHRGRGEYVRGLVKTNVVRGSAIPLQLGVLYGLVSGTSVSYLVANGVGIVVSGVYRYVLESRWTWRE